MSNPQPETYTLFCILEGDKSPFPIKIANNEAVGVLKEAIKDKNPNALANIDARSLVLYQIDVNDDDEILGNVQKKMSESPKALKTTKELSAMYTSAPAKETVHILVQLPGSVDMRRGISSGSGSGSGPEPDDSIGLKRKNIYSDDMDGPQPKRKGPRHSGEKSIGRQLCWGNPLDPALTTLPILATGVGGLELDDEEDTSSVILPGDPYLNIFDTPFLVRAEYIRTFDEVKVVYDDDCKHQPSHQHLAVVTGQPGIGAMTSAGKLPGFTMHCAVVSEKSSPSSGTREENFFSSLTKWKEQDRTDMIKHLSRVPGAAGMRGVLFESQYQHRFAKKIEIVAAPMFRASRPRSRWHAAFGDFSASPKLKEARKSALNTVPSISLSISPSELQTYHSGPLAIEENIYYVPLSENEVAIDSFIVDAGHLYLFQFATGSQHSVNGGLVGRLSQFSHLPVAENWHFIFVVPKTLDKFSCPHSDDGFLHDHVPYVAQIDSPP
ncbi:hypothetical protein CPB86DRAFT_798762 [Serendipita vermifera]|nr:hypothetical protein CPB86DRAFT_798762 [Serendipita vermifera]